MTAAAPGVDPQAAQDLGKELDRAVERFGVEHGALLRQACGVPEHVAKLDLVLLYTFLGHSLDRLSQRTNRKHTEDVIRKTLDQIEAERRAMPPKGSLQ